MTSSARPITPLPSKLIRFVWIALISISIALTVWRTVSSTIAPDSWLHLGIGRYILEHKRVPTHADISYKTTAPAFEWVSDSWVSDIAFYISANPANFLGTGIIQSASLIITSIILVDIGMTLSLPVSLVGLLSIFGITISQSFWRIHPLLFVPALLLLITRFHIRNHVLGASRSRTFGIVVTTLFLSNMAGGFAFLGITLTMLYCVSHILRTIIERSPASAIIQSVRTGFFVSVLSFVTMFLTPSGVRLPIYNMTIIGLLNSRKWYSTLGGALESANSSIIKNAPNGDLFIATLLYIVLLTGILSYLLLTRGKQTIRSLSPVLPLFPFVFLPLIWIRFIPLAIIISLPLFGVLCMNLIPLIPKYVSMKHGLALRIGTIGIALLFIAIGALRQLPTPIRYPSEQLDFIGANQLPEPVLTSTDLVGYVFWRLYPSRGFIDALDYMFDEHDTIAVYSAFAPVTETEMKTLEDTYHFASVLVSKENDYLTGYYSTNPNWTLFYLDYNGILFSKNEAVSDELIRNNGLSMIDFSQNLGVHADNISAAIPELERFTLKHPQSILAIGQLASLYRFTNQPAKAEQTLLTIPKERWDFVVKTEMGRIKAAQGLCKQSEHWFLEALRDRNEQNVSRTTFDLAILYAICLHDMDKAKHYFKRYASYPIPKEERERATQLMKKYVQDLDVTDL